MFLIKNKIIYSKYFYFKVKAPLFYQIFDFDQTRIDLFDFDVGKCTSLPRQKLRLSFTSNFNYFLLKLILFSIWILN